MSRTRLLAALVVVSAVVSAPAGAQGWLDKAKKKAQDKIERRIDQRTDQAIEKGIDKGEAAVRCAATDTACIDGAKQAGKQVEIEGAGAAPGVNQGSQGVTGASAASARAAAPTVNAGKDFTPGTRVILATDFARDELGDFPRKFELKSGNMEVADVGGTRYLRMTSFGSFEIPLPEQLPEMFTFEFDLKPVSGWTQYVFFTDEGDNRAHLVFGGDDGGIEGPKSYRVRSGVNNPDRKNHVFRVQVMADGRYVKVYIDGKRVANAPNADIGRSNKIVFKIAADDDHPAMVGNIRIAAGGKDLYKALEETGRVTAEGIFFDTNSDRIRPESEPALRQIGDMLKAHPEMKLGIEGHTDNVGQASANQSLSEKRAAAVKAYLTTTYGIAGGQMVAKGFGASKPAAANDSDEGRQKNRRVELVKQ